MTTLDKIRIWFLFNQDHLTLIFTLLIITSLFIPLCSGYNFKRTTNYDKYQGRVPIATWVLQDCYGSALYGSAEPAFTGINLEYHYIANGRIYSNHLFYSSAVRSKIFDFIYKNQMDSLIVCYNIDKPDLSVLKVRKPSNKKYLPINFPFTNSNGNSIGLIN